MAKTSKISDRPAVTFLLYEYPLGINITVINLAELFAEKGYSVQILIDRKTFIEAPIKFRDSRIKVELIGEENSDIPGPKDYNSRINFPQRAFIWGKRALFYTAGILLIRKPHIIINFVKFIDRPYYEFCKESMRILKDGPRFLIGVEIFGLFAGLLSRLDSNRQCLIYLNMELFHYKRTLKSTNWPKKTFELCSLRSRTNFVTIQDEKRRDAFLRANPKYPLSRIILLPVTARAVELQGQSDYFRQKFAISPNRKIILHAGRIVDWAMSYEIVESAKNWPDEYVLIMHSYYLPDKNTEYFLRVDECAAKGKVFFSFGSVDYYEFNELLASAHVGLLFYKGTEENFIEIGSSSNKLAQYLRVGLPVISNSLPSLKAAIEGNKCGICVPRLTEIPQALSKITAEINSYKQNAIDCFRRQYDFSPHFEKFYKVIAGK
jgi:glycosyltransferase involved in cell wall biosynthesis